MTNGGRPGSWLLIAGGVLMVLAYPLDWSRVDGASGDNPFHYPLTGGTAWLLVVLSGVAVLAARAGFGPASRLPRVAYTVATGLATVIMVVQLSAGGRTIHHNTPMELDRGPGMWLALIASLASCAGAMMLWRTTTSALAVDEAAGRIGQFRGRRRSRPSVRRLRSG